MTDPQDTPAADVVNYTPPSAVTQNNNVQAIIDAAVARAVAEAVAQAKAEATAAAQPKVLSPEEAARAALDNAGVGLGIEERLQELYKHVALLASKVGI